MYTKRTDNVIQLQHELMESQQQGTERIRPDYASVRCQKEIEQLSKSYSTDEISYILDVPLTYAKSRLARIEEQKEQRRRFLTTGQIPQQQGTVAAGYYAILPK